MHPKPTFHRSKTANDDKKITINPRRCLQRTTTTHATKLKLHQQQRSTFYSKSQTPTPYKIPIVNPDEIVLQSTRNQNKAQQHRRQIDTTLNQIHNNIDDIAADPAILPYTHPIKTQQTMGGSRSDELLSSLNQGGRINPHGVSNTQLIQNLTFWMRQHGAYIHPSIQVKSSRCGPVDINDSNNWGLFVTERIPQFTVLAAVPYPLMIQQTYDHKRVSGFVSPQESLVGKAKEGSEEGTAIAPPHSNTSNPSQPAPSPDNSNDFLSSKQKAKGFEEGREREEELSKNDQNGHPIDDQNQNQKTSTQSTTTTPPPSFTIPPKLFTKISKFPHGTAVSLFLHLCNIETSPYRDYLATLPNSYPQILSNQIVPHSFPLSHLSIDSRINIQSSTTIGLLDDYEVVRKFIEKEIPVEILNGSPFNFEIFQFLKNTLDSRGFSSQLLIDSQLTPEVLLIPLLDLCNNGAVSNVAHVTRELKDVLKKSNPKSLFPHSDPSIFSSSDPTKTDYLHYMFTISDVEAGEELFYGYQTALSADFVHPFDSILTSQNQLPMLKRINPLESIRPEDKGEVVVMEGQGGMESSLSLSLLPKKIDRPTIDTLRIQQEQQMRLNPKLKEDFEQGVEGEGVVSTPSSSSITSAKTSSSSPNQRKMPKFSPQLTNLLTSLPLTHPLSTTSLSTTIRHSIGRFPYLTSDDLLTTQLDLPFPHTSLVEKYGIISPGSHRPYFIDLDCLQETEYYYHIKPSFFLNLDNLDNILASAQEFYYQSLKSAHLDEILSSPEYQHHLSKVRARHEEFRKRYEPGPGEGRQNNTNRPEGEPIGGNKNKSGSPSIWNRLKSEQEPMQLTMRERSDLLSRISLPLNTAAPLPFRKALFDKDKWVEKGEGLDDDDDNDGGDDSPSQQHPSHGPKRIRTIPISHPLQQTMHAAAKLMQERTMILNYHGVPTAQEKGVTSLPLESIDDGFETAHQLDLSSKYLQEHLYNNYGNGNNRAEGGNDENSEQIVSTIESVFKPPRQPPQTTQTRFQKILPKILQSHQYNNEYQVLNQGYPFRFGLGTISPQLEAISYLLAAHSTRFDEYNLPAYEELLSLVRDAIDGDNVEFKEWDQEEFDRMMEERGEQGKKGGENVGGNSHRGQSKEKKISKWKQKQQQKNEGGLNRFISIFSGGEKKEGSGDDDNSNNNNSDDNDDNSGSGTSSNLTQNIIAETNLGRLSKFGDVGTTTNPFRPPNQTSVNLIGPLHLPAYSVFLGIMDTVLKVQMPKEKQHKPSTGHPTPTRQSEQPQSAPTTPITNAFHKLNINTASHDQISSEFAKHVTNVPNYVVQHLFNAVATKIGVENHYYDLDLLLDGKLHIGGTDLDADDGNPRELMEEKTSENTPNLATTPQKDGELHFSKIYSGVETPVGFISGDVISNFGNRSTD